MGWFLEKFDAEVSSFLVTEKVFKRFMSSAEGGGAPDMVAIRAARTNLRYHLKYIGWLLAERNWLAGSRMTYADLAAAAQLSSMDFLGNVPWDEDETARTWYSRVKSRPASARSWPTNCRHHTAGALRRPRFLRGDSSGLREERVEQGRRAALLPREHAKLGFSAFGITSPAAVPELGARLRAWLASGEHGDMIWMARDPERRASPRALWEEVRSIVMLGLDAPPASSPLEALTRRDTALIASYARRRDYHDVIKGRLKELAQALVSSAEAEVKVFVDTAPVMEKPLAAAAGLGWQGKHTVLLSRELGSWLLLGAIFTTAELPIDEPGADHCGSCRRCLDICPTKAFPAPYRLDARRCIAYLTIEHKGAIPREFREAIGNRVFGCDDCLAVCPWNKYAKASQDMRMAERGELNGPALGRVRASRRRGFPQALRRHADQAHGSRSLYSQCAHRHRQFGKARACVRGRALARRPLPSGARHGGLGCLAPHAQGSVRRARRSATEVTKPTRRCLRNSIALKRKPRDHTEGQVRA